MLKAGAAASQRIELQGLELVTPAAAQIPKPDIIGKQEDDVGFVGGAEGRRRGEEAESDGES